MTHVPAPPACPLCGEPVAPLMAVVETAAFLTKRDPLWRYAGRRMHRECFRYWPRRAEFVHKFNVVMEGLHRMSEDGEVTDLPPG